MALRKGSTSRRSARGLVRRSRSKFALSTFLSLRNSTKGPNALMSSSGRVSRCLAASRKVPCKAALKKGETRHNRSESSFQVLCKPRPTMTSTICFSCLNELDLNRRVRMLQVTYIWSIDSLACQIIALRIRNIHAIERKLRISCPQMFNEMQDPKTQGLKQIERLRLSRQGPVKARAICCETV